MPARGNPVRDTAAHVPKAVDQTVGGETLLDQSMRAQRRRPLAESLFGKAGEDDDAGVGRGATYPGQCRKAVHDGHRNIKQYEVRACSRNDVNSFDPVPCLADDHEVRLHLQQKAHEVAHTIRIVGHDDTNSCQRLRLPVHIRRCTPRRHPRPSSLGVVSRASPPAFGKDRRR